MAERAIKYNVNYLAFGSFYKSKLKPNAKKADIGILKQTKNIKQPIVVIGGINNFNYKRLIKLGAKYIAISSFIWDNPKLKPEVAIKKIYMKITAIEIKPGMIIEHKNDLWNVLKTQHVKPGKEERLIR